MVYNYAKLALFTGFALMTDAKKGKYGNRNDIDDDNEEIADDTDSRGFDLMDRLAKRLGKKGKGKKGCNEKDFTKGVLEAISEALPQEGEETVSLAELGDIFEAIFGDDFDPEDNKAFERGERFGEKKLGREPGCREECRRAPWAEECESCCQTYAHRVDWNCDSTDLDAAPPAKCCTEWTEECYTTASEDNHNHACKDCYGYEYGPGWGDARGWDGEARGWEGWGRYGRRRASMMNRLAKWLGKKGGKGKKGCNEKDFTKGVLEAIAQALPQDGEETISLAELDEMFEAIYGDNFDPEDNKAFDRGVRFGEKKLFDQPGCREECRRAPWAAECESCCQTYSHEVDWNCDSTDPDTPPATCCTEWSKECYTTDSEKNNNHACKDCGYGYGRGYGYGGYGRGYGRRYGRRRAEATNPCTIAPGFLTPNGKPCGQECCANRNLEGEGCIWNTVEKTCDLPTAEATNPCTIPPGFLLPNGRPCRQECCSRRNAEGEGCIWNHEKETCNLPSKGGRRRAEMCESYADCGACLADEKCIFDNESMKCAYGETADPTNGDWIYTEGSCPATSTPAPKATNPTCESHTDCGACLEDENCVFDKESMKCAPGLTADPTNANWIFMKGSCPQPPNTGEMCESYTDCGACMDDDMCIFDKMSMECVSGQTADPDKGDWIFMKEMCPSSPNMCGSYPDCESCMDDDMCIFNAESMTCALGETADPTKGSWVFMKESCSA